jgi:hypothetical protein
MIITRGFPGAILTRGFASISIPVEIVDCIEQILTHVTATLSNFSWANFSPTNIYRGIRFFDGSIDSVPFIAIIPGKTRSTDSPYGVNAFTMNIDVSAVVRLVDENASQVGESILGEMIEAVFSNTPIGASQFVYAGGGVDGYPTFTDDLMTVGITIAIAWQYADNYPGQCLDN